MDSDGTPRVHPLGFQYSRTSTPQSFNTSVPKRVERVEWSETKSTRTKTFSSPYPPHTAFPVFPTVTDPGLQFLTLAPNSDFFPELSPKPDRRPDPVPDPRECPSHMSTGLGGGGVGVAEPRDSTLATVTDPPTDIRSTPITSPGLLGLQVRNRKWRRMGGGGVGPTWGWYRRPPHTPRSSY